MRWIVLIVLVAIGCTPAPTTIEEKTEGQSSASTVAADSEQSEPLHVYVPPGQRTAGGVMSGPPTSPIESRPIGPDDIGFWPDDPAALFALPVSAANLKLVLEQGEQRLDYIDTETQGFAVVTENRVEGPWGVSRDWVWFEGTEGVLHRWFFDDGSTITTKMPISAKIGHVMELVEGAFAVASFDPVDPRISLLDIFEADGALRCSIETEDGVVLTRHGDIVVHRRGPQGVGVVESWAINAQTCLRNVTVPQPMQDGVRFGATGNVVIINEFVETFARRLVRYDFTDGTWNQTAAGDTENTIFIQGRGGTSLLWGKAISNLYQISSETLEIEQQWSVSECGESGGLELTDDAAWVIDECTGELVRVDAQSGLMERFDLPINARYAGVPRSTAEGLLFGWSTPTYFFNFSSEALERMPDWFIVAATDAQHWKVRPGS